MPCLRNRGQRAKPVKSTRGSARTPTSNPMRLVFAQLGDHIRQGSSPEFLRLPPPFDPAEDVDDALARRVLDPGILHQENLGHELHIQGGAANSRALGYVVEIEDLVAVDR